MSPKMISKANSQRGMLIAPTTSRRHTDNHDYPTRSSTLNSAASDEHGPRVGTSTYAASQGEQCRDQQHQPAAAEHIAELSEQRLQRCAADKKRVRDPNVLLTHAKVVDDGGARRDHDAVFERGLELGGGQPPDHGPESKTALEIGRIWLLPVVPLVFERQRIWPVGGCCLALRGLLVACCGMGVVITVFVDLNIGFLLDGRHPENEGDKHPEVIFSVNRELVEATPGYY